MKGPGTPGRPVTSAGSNAHYLTPALLVAIGLCCLALAIPLYLIGESLHRTQACAEEIPARNDAQICEPLSHTALSGGGQESESQTERIGEPPVINAAEPPSPALDGMAWILGGDFSMGSEDASMGGCPATRTNHLASGAFDARDRSILKGYAAVSKPIPNRSNGRKASSNQRQ